MSSNNDSLFTRRNLLALGGAGIAASLVGPALLSPRSAEAADKKPAKVTSCVVLWMQGGPSHIDTFDPKKKSGGPAKDMATRAGGVRISEHLPQVADEMDKIALVRGMSSKEGNHQRAQELGHTGHPPNPTVRSPSIGAWVVRERGPSELEIPSFISLGGPSHGGGFFGNAFDPFIVQRPGEMPDNMAPARRVSTDRASSRRAVLAKLDERFGARTGDPQVKARRDLYARAEKMMRASATSAFDLSGEPKAVVDAYGDSDFGRGCLVARRLVEQRVPFVEVSLDGWDTHEDNFERTGNLMASLDPAMASLIRDLEERSLLDSTLIVWMGDFGRTPRINGREGRDHYPAAYSVALAGGGVRGGTVFGSTDEEGATVVDGPTSVPDLIATIGWRLGVDPGIIAWTPQGRPFNSSAEGTVRKDWFG
ncbi:MAG: DUF1501 domain-containing protein [Myxococcales bacterium]|nr:DUF1501 domain-containing protein [Myxococcales bacterium]